MITSKNITTLANLFCLHRNIGKTSVAAIVMNDRSFFIRLKAGRGITLNSYNKIIQWFSDNWPENLAWPKDIERPKVSGGVGFSVPSSPATIQNSDNFLPRKPALAGNTQKLVGGASALPRNKKENV